MSTKPHACALCPRSRTRVPCVHEAARACARLQHDLFRLQEYKISLGDSGDELDRVLVAIDETDDNALNYLHVFDAVTGK